MKKETIEFAVPEGFELPENGNKIEVLATLIYNEDTGLLELQEVDGYPVTEEEVETEEEDMSAAPTEAPAEDMSIDDFLAQNLPPQ